MKTSDLQLACYVADLRDSYESRPMNRVLRIVGIASELLRNGLFIAFHAFIMSTESRLLIQEFAY